MNYFFPKASLTTSPAAEHKQWLEILNVTLEVVHGEVRLPSIQNPALNGKLNITGSFDIHCTPNKCPVLRGRQGLLKVHLENKFSMLLCLFLDCPEITTPGPFRRRYKWLFGGIQRPLHDQIGFVPDLTGEVTIDELLELLGASRQEMEKSACKFNSEGGFQ
jgi:hypothetical protein